MRHRNEYSHHYDNTQNGMVGQVGEQPRVTVPATFNKTCLEQKLAGKIMGTLQKIGDDTRHERSTACPCGRHRKGQPEATTEP